VLGELAAFDAHDIGGDPRGGTPVARKAPVRENVVPRFNAPLTFFNADYFKERALAAADAAGPNLQWFVIDAIPLSDMYALRDLRETLEARGTLLVLAGRRTEILNWFREIGHV
jgi:MFS superfamily sulfate permease-like transporter